MGKVLCERDDLVAVADNIRSLTGETGEMTLAEMATAQGSGGGGSGGGSVETVTITIEGSSPMGVQGQMFYVDTTGVVCSIGDTVSVEVPKNSLILFSYTSGTVSTGGLTLVLYDNAVTLCQATKDATVYM